MDIKKLLLVVLIGCLMPAAGSAALVTWELTNVTMGDDAIVTGSYIVDTSNETLVDWSISIDGGNVLTFPAFTWTKENSQAILGGASFNPNYGVSQTTNFITSESFNVLTPAGWHIFTSRVLNFYSPAIFSENIGVINLVWLNDCYNCSPYRSMVSGGQLVQISSVPLPSALLLFGSALLGLIGVAKRGL